MVKNWLSILQNHRLIAVIRCDNYKIALKMAHILAQNSVRLIEITWNSDQPLKLISTLRQQLPHCYIGVGTIIHHQDLINAIDAGIQFAFSPHFDLNLVKVAHSHDIPFTPGALSPSEIINAFNGGAKTIKVFPIHSLGGVDYLKTIIAPLNHIPLIPTGGVTMASAHQYIKAGAVAVGLSTDLFPLHLLKEEKWDIMSQRIKHTQQLIGK